MGKPAMLYFSERPVNPNKIDLDQIERLKEFRQETYKSALVGSFSTPREFEHRLLRDLVSLIRSLRERHPKRNIIHSSAKSEDPRDLLSALIVTMLQPAMAAGLPEGDAGKIYEQIVSHYSRLNPGFEPVLLD
jgi:hypothetical protein